MKLLTFTLYILSFSANMLAQKKVANGIPQNIAPAFNTQYPQARVLHCKIITGGATVTFKMNDKKYCAFYSASGDWQKTERKIKPWQLAAAIKNTLHNSEYAAWYIDDVKEVSTPGSHVYLVHVDDANVLTITDAYLFKDDYQLTFSETGELIKKEKLP
jgi:hypothetical protein